MHEACVYIVYLLSSISVIVFMHVSEEIHTSESWPCDMCALASFSVWFGLVVHVTLQGTRLALPPLLIEMVSSKAADGACSLIYPILRMNTEFIYSLCLAAL